MIQSIFLCGFTMCNISTCFFQIFECNRMKFSEIPQRLSALLLPPDPIVIHHLIRLDSFSSIIFYHSFSKRKFSRGF